jgi:rod shape-determining protein MreC
MFVFLSRYRVIIVLALLCIISLLLSWHTAKNLRENTLKNRLSTALFPTYFASSVINSISDKFINIGSFFSSIFRKPADRARLKNLENKLEILKMQLDEERNKCKRLKELYETYKTDPASKIELLDVPEPLELETKQVILAKVIAVEPTEWFRYLTINRGLRHGIAVDMPVITRSEPIVDASHLTEAVVGRVSEVHERTSKVQLITDRWSTLAVTIDPLEDLVLLKGQPETEDCVIEEIPSTTHELLKEGNAVVVDDRSSIFPSGMLVGRISSIKEGVQFCRIRVQPAFNFKSLREVMVVIDE